MFSSVSATSLAITSAGFGVATAAFALSPLVGGAPAAARRIVPFSGGLLGGIALFGILPELAEQFSWAAGLGLLATGVGLLWLFGRYVYPVCPSCSHTHDHDKCTTRLHGFALPLVAAAAIHNLLDGIGIAASRQEQAGSLGTVVLLGVILHKLPEGMALGVILHEALRSRVAALGWVAAIQAATVLGSAAESAVSPHFGLHWAAYALALAGGSFLYLGFHAVHGEWQRRGAPAFMPALTGAVGAAALHQGLHVFLR